MSNSDILQLLPMETELRRVKGDCWSVPGSIAKRQVPGAYTFTDQRILFRGNGLIDALRVVFAIPYGEIVSAEPCPVGPFIPTGIRIRVRDGGTYLLSILKRKEILALIQERMAVK